MKETGRRLSGGGAPAAPRPRLSEKRTAVGPLERDAIRDWFDRYIRTFTDGGGPDAGPMVLKRDHSLRVCEEIVGIGESLNLDGPQIRFAETIALLHDIGRFEQYAVHRTFADRKSVNHAELGARILDRQNVLAQLDPGTAAEVRRAVACHNMAFLPEDLDSLGRMFCLMLRDADKLDIWKVVTDYYGRTEGPADTTIELDLPDTPGVSEAVVRDLMEKRIVRSDHIRNLNDFKLLQVGWVYDIHFTVTAERLRERGFLEKIRAVLPESPTVEAVFRAVADHLNASHNGPEGWLQG
ncbi:HD domain-containing protein [bacterium]|nr:HD domain-containing protein [bacterium]